MTIELAADAVRDRIEERELVNRRPPLGERQESRRARKAKRRRQSTVRCPMGFARRRLGIYEDRFNVFAELRGRRAGPSLARVYALSALAVCAEV